MKGGIYLEDSKIIELFFARSEQAIIELSKKYEMICKKIAKNILNNMLDAEECVNDAYLGMWNTIPPQNPNPLLAYVSRIVRNIAIAKYHSNTALKRNSFYDIALDELESCLASSSSVEDELTAKELTIMLNCFLDTLERKKESCLYDVIGTLIQFLRLQNVFTLAIIMYRFVFLEYEEN